MFTLDVSKPIPLRKVHLYQNTTTSRGMGYKKKKNQGENVLQKTTFAERSVLLKFITNPTDEKVNKKKIPLMYEL